MSTAKRSKAEIEAQYRDKARDLVDNILALTSSETLESGGVDALQENIKRLEAANALLEGKARAAAALQAAHDDDDEVGEDSMAGGSDGDGYSDGFEDEVLSAHSVSDAGVGVGSDRGSPSPQQMSSSPPPRGSPLFKRRQQPPRRRSRERGMRVGHRSQPPRRRSRSRGRGGDGDGDGGGRVSTNTIGARDVRRERAYRKKGKRRQRRGQQPLKQRAVWDKRVVRVPKKMRRYGPSLDVYRSKVSVHCACVATVYTVRRRRHTAARAHSSNHGGSL